MDMVGLEALGVAQRPSAQRDPSSPPPPFPFFLSLSPPPLCNSLPSPHVALSSLLLHNGPKVLLLDSKVVRIHGSLPTNPIPPALALGKGWVHLFWPALSMTLETKLTMAEAGWLGSSSAKRWQALSVVLPCFRATKPKSLQGQERGDRGERRAGGTPGPGELSR